MPGVLRLKDRMLTPAGGFSYIHPSGQEVKGISMQSIINKYPSAFGKSAPLNLADLIDNHTCQRLEKEGNSAFYYEIMPKVKDQEMGKITELDSRFFMKPGGYYYNCGLVEGVVEDYWLVYRRQQYNGDSDICAVELNDSMNWQPLPITNVKIAVPELRPREMLEDPRVIRIADEFYVAFCSWPKGTSYTTAHQRLCVFNMDWSFKREIPLFYGANQITTEKNWSYFEDDRGFMLLYKPHPHEIARINPATGDCIQVIREDWNPSWQWGDLRGGTPPVLVGNEYFSFFHSRYNDGFSGRPRYVAGCYAFSADTFKVTRYTDRPLLRASENDPCVHWAPWVVFPNGSLFKDGKWIVSLGVNDLYCAIWELDHNELLIRMKTVNPLGVKNGK